jgi:hypothetical protein
MKTVQDLNDLIPTLVDMVLSNPEIGSRYYGRCEDDYDEEWANNVVTYEEDGWYIEISFRCIGDWDYYPGDYYTPSSSDCASATGEVTDIVAGYTDEDGNEINFSDNDIKQLWMEVDEALQHNL